MGIMHKTKGGVMPPKQTSATVHVPAGSGHGFVKSKHMIETSAPTHPHHIHRANKGYLK